MIKGLYTAASAMMLQMSRQDVIANNIANVNTSGYKKDTVFCESFPQMLISRLGDKKINPDGELVSMPPVVIGSLSTGAVVSNIITDHTAGNIKNTGVATDLALSGDGFFVIQTPDGERFTRDGSFKINDAGFLVNNVGYPVMNTENQPIAITGEFNVQKNGDILVDNQPIATLKIVDFADRRYLQKEGGWMNARGQGYNVLQNPGVLQFYQESSNVNTMKEMVNLISATRAYEASQKVVQAVDETMGIAINDVGAVS